jgi:hypothetical protein
MESTKINKINIFLFTYINKTKIKLFNRNNITWSLSWKIKFTACRCKNKKLGHNDFPR